MTSEIQAAAAQLRQEKKYILCFCGNKIDSGCFKFANYSPIHSTYSLVMSGTYSKCETKIALSPEYNFKTEQTLEDKLNTFAAMAKDLKANHIHDDGMEGFNLDDICAGINEGVQIWSDYHDDIMNGGETPAQTQAWAMKGERV